MAGCRGERKKKDWRAKQDDGSKRGKREGGRTRGNREKKNTKEKVREAEGESLQKRGRLG